MFKSVSFLCANTAKFLTFSLSVSDHPSSFYFWQGDAICKFATKKIVFARITKIATKTQFLRVFANTWKPVMHSKLNRSFINCVNRNKSFNHGTIDSDTVSQFVFYISDLTNSETVAVTLCEPGAECLTTWEKFRM